MKFASFFFLAARVRLVLVIVARFEIFHHRCYVLLKPLVVKEALMAIAGEVCVKTLGEKGEWQQIRATQKACTSTRTTEPRTACTLSARHKEASKLAKKMITTPHMHIHLFSEVVVNLEAHRGDVGWRACGLFLEQRLWPAQLQAIRRKSGQRKSKEATKANAMVSARLVCIAHTLGQSLFLMRKTHCAAQAPGQQP